MKNKHKRKGMSKSLMKSDIWRTMTDSVKADWRSPKKLIKLIAKKFGAIGLDPCASHIVKHQFATKNFTGKKKEHDDGLKESWRGYGLVYANVPYGKTATTKWVQKAVIEFTRDLTKRERRTEETTGIVDELIMLVPARTDTRWFQNELLPFVDGACFWRGRMVFGKKRTLNPKRCKKHTKKNCKPCSFRKDPAPFASLLVYFGPRRKLFKDTFTKYGWTIIQDMQKEKRK